MYAYETKRSSCKCFTAMTACSLVDDKHLSIFMFPLKYLCLLYSPVNGNCLTPLVLGGDHRERSG